MMTDPRPEIEALPFHPHRNNSGRMDTFIDRAAVLAILARPAPLSCRHDAKWIEQFTDWAIRAHEQRKSEPGTWSARNAARQPEPAREAALREAVDTVLSWAKDYYGITNMPAGPMFAEAVRVSRATSTEPSAET